MHACTHDAAAADSGHCGVRYLRTGERTAARSSLERAGWRAVGVLPLSLGDVAQHSAIVCRVGEAACLQALEMSCDDASVLLGNNAYLLVYWGVVVLSARTKEFNCKFSCTM